MIYYNKLNVPFDYKNPSCEKGHFINFNLTFFISFLVTAQDVSRALLYSAEAQLSDQLT